MQPQVSNKTHDFLFTFGNYFKRVEVLVFLSDFKIELLLDSADDIAFFDLEPDFDGGGDFVKLGVNGVYAVVIFDNDDFFENGDFFGIHDFAIKDAFDGGIGGFGD